MYYTVKDYRLEWVFDIRDKWRIGLIRKCSRNLDYSVGSLSLEENVGNFFLLYLCYAVIDYRGGLTPD